MSTFKKRILAVFSAAAIMFTASIHVYADELPKGPAIVSEDADYQAYLDAISDPDVVDSAYSDTGYYIAKMSSEGIGGTNDLGTAPTLLPTTANQAEVKSAMLAKKTAYPEGKAWTNDDEYIWSNIFIVPGESYAYSSYTGGGCHGFAMILSDAAFGTAYARRVDTIDYDKIYIGDILRINGNSHTVIIIDKTSSGVTIAEGNYNKSIHWGRTLTKAQVLAADYYITRYAEGYVDTGIAINATNFPDANFRSFVSDNIDGNDGSAKDGKLSEAEIAAVTNMNISYSSVGAKISNLKGIENFTALESFTCDGQNGISSIDLSKNTALETLHISGCDAQTLNVSGCTELLTLDCSYNSLTSLDLSKNTKLNVLDCSLNHLPYVDLSKNTFLIPSKVNVNGNLYPITCAGGKFKLSKITGFNAAKASDWEYATYNSSTNTLEDINTSYNITYTYNCGQSVTATFGLAPTAAAVKSIRVKKAPSGTFYEGTPVADLFAGCILTVTYEEGSTEDIPITGTMVSDYDSTKTTRQTVTITYGGKTVTQAVTLTALKATVLKLSETYPPTSKFILGDSFSVGTGCVYMELNNGTNVTLDMTDALVEVDSSKFKSDTLGKYNITVKAYSKSLTYTVEVVLDPATAPVILSDGDNEYPFATVTDAFKKINELKNNNADYTIRVKKTTIEGALTFPKAAKSLTILTETGAQIKTTSATLTFATTTTLGTFAKGVLFTHIDNKGNTDGKVIGIKCAANTTVNIYGGYTWGDVSGANTTDLYMEGGTVNSLSTFRNVQLYYQLGVMTKVSGITNLEAGSFRLFDWEKGSISITTVEYGFFTLKSGYDKKGKLTFPKVTVSEVTDELQIDIVDGSGNTIPLTSGTPVMTVGNKGDVASIEENVEMKNEDGTKKLKAFVYKNEARAEYPDALTLEGVGNLPNFEQAFAKINQTGDNVIILHTDISPAKFTLPTKAGSITIKSDSTKRTLTLPKLAAIAPAYDFTLEDLIVISEGAKTFAINGKKNVTINSCSIAPVPSVSAGAGSTLTIAGSRMDFLKLSGTKTTTLKIDYYTDANEVSTFGEVIIADSETLSVSGKATAIDKLNGGTLRMLWADKKCSAAIKEVGTATLALDYDEGTITNATVTSITGTLTLKLFKDFTDMVLDIPSGTSILTAGGNDDISGKIVVVNKNANPVAGDDELKAFQYKKEIRAEYAGMIKVSGGINREFPNFETAIKAIDDNEAARKKSGLNPTSYLITVKSEGMPEKITLPKTADTLNIVSSGTVRTINMVGTTSLTAKYNLTLQNINFKNVNAKGEAAPLTINQNEGTLRIVRVGFNALPTLKGSTKSVLEINQEDIANSDIQAISGFNTVTVTSTSANPFKVGKSFTFNKLIINSNSYILVPNNCTFSVKDIEGKSNSSIKLVSGFKPITISGTASGTISLISDEVIGEDVQILNSAKCDLGVFDVSGISGGSDEYTLSRNGSKVYRKYGYFSMGGVLYASLDDVAAAIEALKAKDAEYTVNLLNDGYSCKALKLPKAGTYGKFTIKADEKYTISFSGNIALTGNTVINGIKLVSKDNKGNIAKYTITPARNCEFTVTGDAYLGKVSEIKGANSKVKLNTMGFNTEVPVKITADKFEYGTVNGIIDTLTCNTIQRVADCPALRLLMKKSCTNTVKTGILNNSSIGIIMVDADNGEAVVPAGSVIFTTFKGYTFDGKVSILNDSRKLVRDAKFKVTAATA